MSDVNQDINKMAETKPAELVEMIYQMRATVENHEKSLTDIKGEIQKPFLETSEGKTMMEHWQEDYKTRLKEVQDRLDTERKERERLQLEFANVLRSPVTAKDQKEDQKAKMHVSYGKALLHMGRHKVSVPHDEMSILTDEDRKMLEDGVCDGMPIKLHEERKAAMRTDNYGRAGSLMMPTEMTREIIDNTVQDISNVSQYCRKYSTVAESLMFPKITAHAAAGWLGAEGTTRTADETMKFGTKTVNLHWLYARYQIGIQMLRYADFPLVEIMAQDYQDSMSKLIGTAQFNGSGIQEPPGIMNEAGISSRNQGEAAILTNADGIMQLFRDFKPIYRPNLIAVFNRSTEATLCILKNGMGDYMLRSLPDSIEFRLCGHPVHLAEDMPDIGAGTYPIIVGDFKRGAVVLTPKQAAIRLYDDITNSTTGLVNYQITTTYGFSALVDEAFKKLKISA